jgi:hypothetical protein
MNRVLLGGIAAGILVAGPTLIATFPTTPSLPDVQVPAIELSNAGEADATAAWLGLFLQTSGSNANPAGVGLLDSGQLGLPAHVPLIVIEPEGSDQDFEQLLDGFAGKTSNPLEAVTSAINGPDAVTYLTPANGANGS